MSNNTIHIIGRELGKVLLPIEDMLSSPERFSVYMEDMGWTLPNIPTPIQDLNTNVTSIKTKINSLSTSSGIQVYIDIKDLAVSTLSAIDDLVNANFSSYSSLPTDFKNIFPGQFVDYLIIRYIATNSPKAYGIINLYPLLVFFTNKPTTLLALWLYLYGFDGFFHSKQLVVTK